MYRRHAEVIAILPTWLTAEHLNNAVEACILLLQSAQPTKLQFSAAHLLASLANKKFTPHPMPSLLPLFQTNLSHLNTEVSCVHTLQKYGKLVPSSSFNKWHGHLNLFPHTGFFYK